MRSERTVECIKKKRQYVILSWLLCFGICVGLFIYGFCTKWTGNNGEVSQHIKAIMIIWIMSILPMVVLSFLVKDKIKPTIRMVNVILSAYLVANWFMFIVGALMLFDTYVLSRLIKHYTTAIVANKELDNRL